MQKWQKRASKKWANPGNKDKCKALYSANADFGKDDKEAKDIINRVYKIINTPLLDNEKNLLNDFLPFIQGCNFYINATVHIIFKFENASKWKQFENIFKVRTSKTKHLLINYTNIVVSTKIL